jgi:Lrp/AsnC family transcriptional regulator, leucine-responsive regulatory protein
MPKQLSKTSVFAYSPVEPLQDPVNVRILDELQRNPRLTMKELGRRIGMSSPAITERVHRLEESGVIKGYRLDVNPVALGLPIAAYIRIRPNPGQLPRIAELAQQIPEITECYRVTGEDCFFMKVYLPAMDQLDKLLDKFLIFGVTTTSIIQSSPIPLRSIPIQTG